MYLFAITVILLSMHTSLLAQDKDSLNDAKHRIGFITGFGNQNNLNVKYKYEVIFFQFQYYYAFLPKKPWDVDILFQPQYNVMKFRYNDTVSTLTNGFEFGLNVGVLIRKNIYKDYIKMYACVSAGPHYVSGTPKRQTAGFIFSDNFFVGLNIKLSRKSYFDLRSGFRHISNAGLKDPNRGINNLVLSGGVLIDL